MTVVNDSAPMLHVSEKPEASTPPLVVNDEKMHSTSSPPSSFPEQDNQSYPEGIVLWMTLFALICSTFFCALDTTVVATSVPAITDDFHGIHDVAWYGAAFSTTCGAFQSTWGKIYKYFNVRYSYLAAMCTFEIGSLICALAPSSTIFIIGRAIAGVGAAGVMTGSFTIIVLIIRPSRRAIFTGLVTAIYGVACVLGPLVGGAFSTNLTWRWCFWINLPIGVLPLVLMIFVFRLPKSVKPEPATWKEKLLQMDLAGTTLMTAGVVTLLLGLQYGGQILPWSSATVVGLLVGAGLIFIAFGLHEYRQAERAAIVPRLLTRRDILIPALYSIILPGVFQFTIYFLPIYFQAVQGSNSIRSGVQSIPFILVALLAGFGSGVFMSATGRGTLVLVVGASFGTVGCGLLTTLAIDTRVALWTGFQIIVGFGLGVGFQVPLMMGQASVESADQFSTTAILLCFQTVGSAFGLAAAQSVLVNTLIGFLERQGSVVDPMTVIATGAGELRSTFSGELLGEILQAYLEGLKAAFRMGCAMSGLCALLALFAPWKRLGMESDDRSESEG
jgi:MFS family permease